MVVSVLADGAALFYVSAKDEKNCDLLSSYLQHRIYGFPFTHNAYVVEKDCIFMWAFSFSICFGGQFISCCKCFLNIRTSICSVLVLRVPISVIICSWFHLLSTCWLRLFACSHVIWASLFLEFKEKHVIFPRYILRSTKTKAHSCSV